MATQFKDLATNKNIIMGDKNMEKITEKQAQYLIKMGKTEKDIKNLTKAQASQLIVETLKAKKEQPKKVETETPKKTTSTKKETSKKATTTKTEKPKTDSKSADTDLAEALTKAIKVAYNGELKNELSFLQESKIDELAIFIIEYAKKNAKNGGFGLDTKTLLDLSKKFAEQPKKQEQMQFSFNIDFNNNTETKKETKENKTKETKKTTKKASTTKKAETPKKDTSKAKDNDLFEQLCLMFQ